MTGQYKLTRLAEQDIESIAQFIWQDSPDSALRFTEEVERICQLLSEMPDLGADIPFIHSPQFQYFPVGKFQDFLIFYQVNKSKFEIVRVLHRNRDIESLFEED